MSIIQLVVILIVVGVALWAIGLLPLDPTIKKIIHAVVVVAVVLWLLIFLLRFFDLAGGLG